MTGESEVCASTGMALLPAFGQQSYRLAKPSFGALNPKTRGISSNEDRSSWNRFDLPGEKTIYCASSREGAYGELLGALKTSGPHRASHYLDDSEDVDLYTLIEQDWAELGALPPGVIDIGWLYEHRMYTVEMPTAGHFVEIERSRSLTYLTSHIPVSLYERGVTEITVAQTRSSDRHLTTELAATLAAAPLEGGATPLGVHYYSKHGSEWSCWAVWLLSEVANSLKEDSVEGVLPPPQNAALATVLDSYNLTTR